MEASKSYQTFKTLVKEHSESLLIVILVFASVMFSALTYVWSEYKEVMEDRKSIYDERILLEKTRSVVSIGLIEKKAELENRESRLQQIEGQYKEKLDEILNRENEHKESFKKLEQTQSVVSKAQLQKEAEGNIQKLMSEFRKIGVDLKEPIRCGDTDGQAKFNEAKIIFSEIYTIAAAHDLTERYDHFFFKNGGMTSWNDCQ